MNKRSISRLFSGSILALQLAVLISCGSSSSSGPVAPTTVAGAVAAVQKAVVKANISTYATPAAVSLRSNSSRTTSGTMSATDWTAVQTGVINNLSCVQGTCAGSTTSSAALWVQDMMSPTFVNSSGSSIGLMGRFVSVATQACIIGYVLGGLPTAGTQTFSITPDVVTAANVVCNSNQTLPGTLSATFVTTDVSTSGTGTFDRKIVISDTTNSINQTLFVKNDGTNLRFMVMTSNTNQGYPYQNRYYADYNISTQIAHFEGVEGGYPTSGGAGFYLYRSWTNGSTGEVRVLGQNGGVTMSGATRVNQSHTGIAISGNYNQPDASVQFVANSGSGYDKTGCINMSTGAVDTSVSAGDCAGHLLNSTLSSGNVSDVLINTTAFPLTAGQWNLTETISTPSFDDTTVFSAAPQN